MKVKKTKAHAGIDDYWIVTDQACTNSMFPSSAATRLFYSSAVSSTLDLLAAFTSKTRVWLTNVQRHTFVRSSTELTPAVARVFSTAPEIAPEQLALARRMKSQMALTAI
jgi:hypothetical protein